MMIVLLVSTLLTEANELKVSADIWIPYNGIPNSQAEGFAIEILREIFEPKGIVVSYEIKPLSRAVLMGYKGTIDAIVGALHGDAQGYVFPKELLGYSINAFYTKQGDNWTYNGFESLNDKKIGVINSYSYGKDLEQYIVKNLYQFEYVAEEKYSGPQKLEQHLRNGN